MSAFCSLSARGVYGPTVPLKSLAHTHTRTHTLLLCIANTSPGLVLVLHALIYSSVRVRGGPQMEQCVGVCFSAGERLCVYVYTAAYLHTRIHECTRACLRAACVRRWRMRSLLQSSSKMPWKWSLCLAALLFFPLIMVNVRLILPALLWLLVGGSSSPDRRNTMRRGRRKRRRRRKTKRRGGHSLLLNSDPGTIVLLIDQLLTPPSWSK